MIWSGGQTGVDRAAWDAAIDSGLKQTGWVPKGRQAEDGVIPDRYEARETDRPDYVGRTERNLREADCTLIVSFGPPQGGTLFTMQMCRKYRRPHIAIDLELMQPEEARKRALEFLRRQNPSSINVAGPRGSFRPDVYPRAYEFLKALFDDLRKLGTRTNFTGPRN
ncbi:MAG: putative molybdenum carrier protein [Pseudomonadota bacterium]